jgi:hypothetical protein
LPGIEVVAKKNGKVVKPLFANSIIALQTQLGIGIPNGSEEGSNIST